MASGLFIGLEEGELLTIRKTAIEGITKGLNVVSYSDSGSSVTKSWALKPEVMLAEANYGLYMLDPQQYASLQRRSVIGVRWDSRIF